MRNRPVTTGRHQRWRRALPAAGGLPVGAWVAAWVGAGVGLMAGATVGRGLAVEEMLGVALAAQAPAANTAAASNPGQLVDGLPPVLLI